MRSSRQDTPDPKKEGADLTYYLRFDVDPQAAGVFNNHIPVDPLSSLIRLEKRSDRSRASVGDIVTYTISVENRSTRAFFAAGAARGHRGRPAPGVPVPAATSRRIRRLRAERSCSSDESSTTDLDGGAACISSSEPSGVSARVIHFGPFPLGAGESIRQVYQVAVGLDTRQGSYINRAMLRDERLLPGPLQQRRGHRHRDARPRPRPGAAPGQGVLRSRQGRAGRAPGSTAWAERGSTSITAPTPSPTPPASTTCRRSTRGSTCSRSIATACRWATG